MLFVPDSHRSCGLDNYDWKGKEVLKEEVLRFVSGERKKGLILIGDPGVGKTHLMVGIYKELIKRKNVVGRDVLFLEWGKFIQDVYFGMGQGIVPEKYIEKIVVRFTLVDDIRPLAASSRLWKDVLNKLIEAIYEESEKVVSVLSTNAENSEDLFRRWDLEDYWISRVLYCFDIFKIKGTDRRISR